MKYQQIVALFLGTSQAVLLVDGPHETEKVHALEPIAAHIASFQDFPSQRTAFYVQTEEAPAAKAPEAQKETYVRKYDVTGYGEKGGVEKSSVMDPRIGHTHTTFYDKKNGLWRQDQAGLSQKDAKDIAEANMDEEVHGLASSSGIVDVLPSVKPQAEWKKKSQQLNQLDNEVPHDYGDPAAIAAQNKYTMDQAAIWESQRVAAVNGQQSSDAWRKTGLKAAWGQGQTPEMPKIAAQKQSLMEVPHDYGDPAAISAQHAWTMGLSNDIWSAQNAGVQGQAAKDVWRGQGAKIAWEKA